MRNIFKKIADMIDGKSTDKSTMEPSEVNKGDKVQDSVTNRAELIQKIIGRLTKIYRGSAIDTSDKVLIVWFEDGLLFDSFVEGDFRNQLYSAIGNETDFCFADIQLKKEQAADSDSLSVIVSGIAISVKSREKKVVSQNKRARIIAVEGRGSLCQEEYILDSDKIISSNSFVYNIGTGVSPDINGGGYRVNHIAIDDSETSPQFEKNKYVSRAHAHIGYKTGYGFLLYVEQNGTRMSGKRTRIIRGDSPIEVDNIMVPVPLIDGDFIELSKNVVLQYNELND